MPEHPKVFISYSHDSPEHKRWVSRLALALHQNNVNVTLDQWYLIPGQEWRQFIEDNVRNSDRTLLICTPDYLRKADHGVGGVGLEWQIVTAHLGQDQGVNKFIPIIREPLPKENLPSYLRNLAYFDFTDETRFNEKLGELLHLLDSEAKEQSDLLAEAYSQAVRLAREADLLGWRQLLKRIKPRVFNSLVQWREKELDRQRPQTQDQLVEVMDKAIEITSPLISVALVGVESSREQFRDQRSLLYELLNISGWNTAGIKVWVHIPNALGYVYHSLHGSLSINTNQLDLALNLACVNIPFANGSSYRPLWQTGELRGYPESLGGSCLDGWNYLANPYNDKRTGWNWLSPIFNNELEYRTSLVAYYMALNIHELATIISSGKFATFATSSNPYFQIPLTFLSEDYNTTQRAISLLIRNPEVLSKLWMSVNVTSEQMESAWPDWVRLAENEIVRYQSPSFPRDLLHLSDIYQHLFEGL